MPNSPTNVTPELERLAQSEPGDGLVDIVVELHQDPGAVQSVDQLRESFGRAKEPVDQTIAQLGGTVTDEAWINHTLRARLPAHGLKQLSSLDSVRALDVPHRLKPE